MKRFPVTILLLIAFSQMLISLSCASDSSKEPITATSSPSPSSSQAPSLPAIPSIPSSAKEYHVDPGGNDANPGTAALPYKSISKAVASVKAGEVIYVHGGTYAVSSAISLSANGSPSGWYFLWAYPGEKPVLDFSTESSTSNGINITGSYWYVKGLEITKAGKAGIRIGSTTANGSFNIVENCSTHNCGDSGLYIGTSKGFTNTGNLAAFNQIINCDSYLNYDPAGSTGPGGNADGFACKLAPGKGNVFTGCRSWENSDDGYDLYMADYAVSFESCWTWHNGDPASFGYAGSTWSGNGQGFKVGGGDAAKSGEFYSHGRHVLKNCIALESYYPVASASRGFDRNNNRGGVAMYNCLAVNSGNGFSFSTAPETGYGAHELVSCVVVNCTTPYSLASGTLQTTNSWNLSLTAAAGDYRSLDIVLAKAARQPDGSLPDNDFGKLNPGSQLIGKGTDTGSGTQLGPKR